MNKKLFLLPLLAIISLKNALAHCPLCTAAVGAAAISAKYYGLDVSIIGLMIGAFGISTGLWIALKVKKEYVKFQKTGIVAASFLLTVIPLLSIDKTMVYMPLLLAGPAGSVLNKVYFINKLLIGSIVGAMVSMFAYWLHVYVKKVNGKVIVPFQGIIFTVTLLAISGGALFLIFR